MRDTAVDCRELVGMAKAKRAAGRSWWQVRDDLIYYLQGRGTAPRLRGSGSDYQLVFTNGDVFYHRETGEYGCDQAGADASR